LTFENLFFKDLHANDFAKQQYVRAFKKRPHLSKIKLDSYSNCTYLKAGEVFESKAYNELERRYVSALSLTYDLFVSIYDVNTRSTAAARFVNFDRTVQHYFEGFVKSLRRPALEVRVMGMQDNQQVSTLYGLADMIAQHRLEVFEVDLFGKNTRHIAIDMATGMSFNVLVEDRIYKPGELENKMTMEQFEKGLKA